MKSSMVAKGTLLLVSLVVVFASGCGDDPKERISLLESQNQQLVDDLSACRGISKAARPAGKFAKDSWRR